MIRNAYRYVVFTLWFSLSYGSVTAQESAQHWNSYQVREAQVAMIKELRIKEGRSDTVLYRIFIFDSLGRIKELRSDYNLDGTKYIRTLYEYGIFMDEIKITKINPYVLQSGIGDSLVRSCISYNSNGPDTVCSYYSGGSSVIARYFYHSNGLLKTIQRTWSSGRQESIEFVGYDSEGNLVAP